MLVVGLMSGTSADGIDAALVEWPEHAAARPFRLVAFREDAFPAALQQRVHRLAAGRCEGSEALGELAALDALLAQRFAESALRVVADAGLQPVQIAAIASHGQTVAHHPEASVRGTLQLGSPARLYAATGVPVVSDFRSADMAAGGQGAPLTPFFHHLRFARAGEIRAVLNIGGFTNVTYLPGDGAEDLIAFDPSKVDVD